jgi:hypothetical protein
MELRWYFFGGGPGDSPRILILGWCRVEDLQCRWQLGRQRGVDLLRCCRRAGRSTDSPGAWPAARQRKLLNHLLNSLGLRHSGAARPPGGSTRERKPKISAQSIRRRRLSTDRLPAAGGVAERHDLGTAGHRRSPLPRSSTDPGTGNPRQSSKSARGPVGTFQPAIRSGGSARVLPRRSPSLTVTDSPGIGLAAVGRLVGRVPAISPCDVCFLCVCVWHPCR